MQGPPPWTTRALIAVVIITAVTRVGANLNTTFGKVGKAAKGVT